MKMIKWNIYILKQRVNTIPVIKNGSDILSWLAAIINWNRKCTWSRRSQNEQTLERKMQSIQLNHAQEWHEEIRSCAKFQFKYTVLQNIFPNTNAKIDPKIRMKKKEENYSFHQISHKYQVFSNIQKPLQRLPLLPTRINRPMFKRKHSIQLIPRNAKHLVYIENIQ